MLARQYLVVPLAVEAPRPDRESTHRGVGNFYLRTIAAAVQFRLHLEAVGGRGVGDQAYDGLVIDERSPAPILRDMREEAVLDLVPLAGAGGHVTHAELEAGLGTLAAGLAGSYGVALGAQGTVRFVVLDLDFGHDLPEPEYASLAEFVDAAHDRGAPQRRMRTHVAAKAAPLVAQLRAAFPGVDFAVCSSPRGAHVVTLLDRSVPHAGANELGRRMLAALGDPGRAEAFPKCEASGGRTCRLPLTGAASRLLRDDLLGYRHRSRVEDLQAMLAMRRTDPAAIPGKPRRKRGE